MSENAPFADWYNEGTPLPVCHPIPHCSATIEFDTPTSMIWRVHNHETGELTEERFTTEDDE